MNHWTCLCPCLLFIKHQSFFILFYIKPLKI